MNVHTEDMWCTNKNIKTVKRSTGNVLLFDARSIHFVD